MGFDFLWLIVIGVAAGWLAGQLMKNGNDSLMTDLIVGIVGSILGGYLFGALGFYPGSGLFGSLIVATVGAIILLFLLRAINR